MGNELNDTIRKVGEVGMTYIQSALILFCMGWIAAGIFIVSTELIKLNNKLEAMRRDINENKMG